MSKSRKAAYIILLLLLTGGIVLCLVRWKAWFANPEEPLWEGDTIAYRFHTFGEETLDGFAKYEGAHSVVWQDLHEPDTLMFLLLGDVHNSIDSAHWAALAQRHPHLDFYAQLGDFIERGYFYYEQQLVSELPQSHSSSIQPVYLPSVVCTFTHSPLMSMGRNWISFLNL